MLLVCDSQSSQVVFWPFPALLGLINQLLDIIMVVLLFPGPGTPVAHWLVTLGHVVLSFGLFLHALGLGFSCLDSSGPFSPGQCSS